MNGNILKIFSNDLYGNVDDRQIALFAAFEHKKYMNKYAIFTFENEYNKNKLFYGSIHLKEESIVIFEVPKNMITYIDTFVSSYLEDKIDPKEYEIINIDKIKKVELISSTEKDCDKLLELDKKSIDRPKPVTVKPEKNNGNGGLYFLLFLFILLGAGVTYVYLNPSVIDVKLKKLTCTKKDYSSALELNYTTEKIVRFNRENIPDKISVTETYKFTSTESYKEFKNNQKENTYFKKEGEYKYNDDDYELKIFYTEKTIIGDYNEMYNYLLKDGYTCEEGIYEE